MAPGAPSRLRAAPLVARLRLGSAADQRKQARAQRRAGGEQQKAQHFPEPPLKPALERGRKQGGRVVAPIRHTPIGAVTLSTLTIRVERFPDGRRVVHQRDANEVAARVDAVPILVGQVDARYHFDTAAFPDC